MFQFLSRLFSIDTSSDRTSGGAPKARLGLETAEDRCTPSGAVWSAFSAPIKSYAVQTSQVGSTSPGGLVSLNPQPLPPRFSFWW